LAVTKTLLALRSLAVKEADITLAAGTSTTQRHDTTDANGFVNDSYRAFLTLLTTRGFDFFLLETALAALPTTRADTNEQYSLVDWPSGALSIKRVDVYSSGEWNELQRRDWTQLRSESRSNAATASRPLVYAPKTHGTVATTVFTAGKLALAPFSSNGTFKITYLPGWTDITNDTYLFLFPDEWGAQWVVWDVVEKYSAKDNNARKRYEIAVIKKREATEMIGHFVPQVVATGPLTVTRSPGYNR